MMRGYSFYGRGFCPGFGGGYFGGYMMIAIALVVVIIGFLLFKRSKKSKNDDVLESLKMLYVKGEITEEEFLRRKDVINGK